MEWVEFIVKLFPPERYLFWTKVQGLAWTVADLVIVYYLLRLANLARGACGCRPHRVPYAILVATVALTPWLALAPNGMVFFGLEILITMPHFGLMLFVLIVDAQCGARALYAAASKQ